MTFSERTIRCKGKKKIKRYPKSTTDIKGSFFLAVYFVSIN